MIFILKTLIIMMIFIVNKSFMNKIRKKKVLNNFKERTKTTYVPMNNFNKKKVNFRTDFRDETPFCSNLMAQPGMSDQDFLNQIAANNAIQSNKMQLFIQSEEEEDKDLPNMNWNLEPEEKKQEEDSIKENNNNELNIPKILMQENSKEITDTSFIKPSNDAQDDIYSYEKIDLSEKNINDLHKPLDQYLKPKKVNQSVDTKDREQPQTTEKKNIYKCFVKVSPKNINTHIDKQLYFKNKISHKFNNDKFKDNINSKSVRKDVKGVNYNDFELSEKNSLGSSQLSFDKKNKSIKVLSRESNIKFNQNKLSNQFINDDIFVSESNNEEFSEFNKEFFSGIKKNKEDVIPKKNLTNKNSDSKQQCLNLKLNEEQREPLSPEEIKLIKKKLKMIKMLKKQTFSLVKSMPDALKSILEYDENSKVFKFISKENNEYLLEYFDSVIVDLKNLEKNFDKISKFE